MSKLINILKNKLCKDDLRIFLFLALVFVSFNIQAQVFFNSTHVSIWNQQIEQPALVGNSEGIRTVAAYRYQWVGIEGAPMTAYAGADMKLPLKNLSGGVLLSHDRAGATNYTGVDLSMAYSIPIKNNKINIGAKLGLKSMMIDGSKLTTPTPGDDPLLSRTKESALRPNVGIGIAYIHSVFHIGAFVENVGDFKAKLSGLNTNFKTDFGRYYGIEAAADIPIGSNINIQPAVFLRINDYNHQIDISLATNIFDKYTLGLGARGYNKNSFESLILMTKVDLSKNISIMYSYDIVMNEVRTVSMGSHELGFQYIIPKDYASKRTKIINHPRYL